ncbi:MAG TPA: DUF2148 domain-containing protein [Methanomassiliicoccales archaeon]|jgi:uncharacterized ferredoxin-like protein
MAIKDTVRMVADLMEVAARTAPKGVGKDFIEIKVLSDAERIDVGNEMMSMAREPSRPNFDRDGQNVLDSDGLVLIGLLPHKGAGLNCGACGFTTCAEMEGHPCNADFIGGNCAIRLLDLGIAMGSAVKIASELNVDNRIMYRVGVAARRLGLTKAQIVHGIPLSATGKNIFFDRQPRK